MGDWVDLCSGHTMTNDKAMHKTRPRHVAGNNSILLLFYPKTCLDLGWFGSGQGDRLPSASPFIFIFNFFSLYTSMFGWF